ncbi:MAG: hypothetical protein QNL70_08555 [Pseudomonas sp.]
MSTKPAVKIVAKPKTAPAKRKADAAVATSASINDQISAFLASGGEIQSIPNGTSGQTYGKPATKAAPAKTQKA